MIKLEHVVLASRDQMEFIIEGMRNPMNSWDKSDSEECWFMHTAECEQINGVCAKCKYAKDLFGCYAIGENDLSLMDRLAKAGTEHRKYLRMMPVYVRITAPLYWWKEFETYKVGTVSNSCSTMHKIAAKEFTLDDFSCEHLIGMKNQDMEHPIPMVNVNCIEDTVLCSPEGILSCWTIPMLNECRKLYLQETDKTVKKNLWWQMIQLLPNSYNQTRNVMLNYEVLSNIYHQRNNHKLDEWRAFCEWITTLPYSELIIRDEG